MILLFIEVENDFIKSNTLYVYDPLMMHDDWYMYMHCTRTLYWYLYEYNAVRDDKINMWDIEAEFNKII